MVLLDTVESGEVVYGIRLNNQVSYFPRELTHNRDIKKGSGKMPRNINWHKAKTYNMPEWLLEDELSEMLAEEAEALKEWLESH